MSDITYKKFSELTRTYTLQSEDIIPIAQFVSGISYNSRSVPLSTLYNQTSAALIGPFTTSIQSTVNSGLSSDKWNGTYSTVQANSAGWGTSVTDTLTAFRQGNATSPQVVRFLSAGPVANASVAFIATGTGATLAQLPDSGTSGGNARGNYATDWQKLRNTSSQVATGPYSVIGGGSYNTIGVSADSSTIGGGLENNISSQYSTIGGGAGNIVSGGYATIAGGWTNKAGGGYATIGGGGANVASGDYSSVVGGVNNNTSDKENAHIIGSNMTAPSANFTYVNNISSQGDVRGSNFYGPNIIKAWANFDGVGTGVGTPTIRNSYNINKIQRISEGKFVIEFTSSTFTSANYVMLGNVSNNLGSIVLIDTGSETGAPTIMTSLSCQVKVQYTPGTAATSVRQSHTVCLAFMGT